MCEFQALARAQNSLLCFFPNLSAPASAAKRFTTHYISGRAVLKGQEPARAATSLLTTVEVWEELFPWLVVEDPFHKFQQRTLDSGLDLIGLQTTGWMWKKCLRDLHAGEGG